MRHWLRNPVHAVSLGGGLGLMPWAPGTFGTLPGFALAAGLRLLSPAWIGWLVLAALLGIGTACADYTARQLQQKDPGMIVCDEYLAFAGLLLALPATPVMAAWAFLCFRLFDATKPLSGGLGGPPFQRRLWHHVRRCAGRGPCLACGRRTGRAPAAGGALK